MDLGRPISYLTLERGAPVFSSDGRRIGEVEHILAAEEEDIFDGLVIDATPVPGGRRFADAALVDTIAERGVVLAVDAAATERLPEPSDNPAALDAGPEETVPDELRDKLRRAWDLISGNY